MGKPIAQAVALADSPALCLSRIEVGGGGGDEESKEALKGDGELVRLKAHARR